MPASSGTTRHGGGEAHQRTGGAPPCCCVTGGWPWRTAAYPCAVRCFGAARDAAGSRVTYHHHHQRIAWAERALTGVRTRVAARPRAGVLAVQGPVAASQACITGLGAQTEIPGRNLSTGLWGPRALRRSSAVRNGPLCKRTRPVLGAVVSWPQKPVWHTVRRWVAPPLSPVWLRCARPSKTNQHKAPTLRARALRCPDSTRLVICIQYSHQTPAQLYTCLEPCFVHLPARCVTPAYRRYMPPSPWLRHMRN